MGRDKREATVNNKVAYRFVARYDGHCARCGSSTLAGEDIAALVDGRYVCDGCAGVET